MVHPGRWIGIALPSVLIALVPGASAQTIFDDALSSLERAPPASFAALPDEVVRTLERRGCSIPQSYVDGSLHNVVRGRFLDRESEAWAVLCSVSDTSTILVFGEDPLDEPLEVGRSADSDWIQHVGEGRAAYSRVLGVAPPEYIVERARRYGGHEPLPPLDHDGIADAFAEKGSTVWYRHGGRWHRLPGAD